MFLCNGRLVLKKKLFFCVGEYAEYISLQCFVLNRKKSATKLIHCLCMCISSQRRAGVCLPGRSRSRMKLRLFFSQPARQKSLESKSRLLSSSVEPVHNGKISMRSPLSNAMIYRCHWATPNYRRQLNQLDNPLLIYYKCMIYRCH